MKKSFSFVFCHGFGFNRDFWQPLQPYFNPMKTTYLDLGYFGNENLQIPPDTTVAIGHSLGFAKLLSMNLPFQAMIGLHGFTDFLGHDGTLNRRRKHEFMHFQRQCKHQTEMTLHQFYHRVGVSCDISSKKRINRAAIEADLNFLTKHFQIPPDVPILILGSDDDEVVPKSVIEDNFNEHPKVSIKILNHGQHGLGHLKPKEVYQEIMEFLTAISVSA